MGTDVDRSIPSPARVYDYWLGGKDNFAADREAAEKVTKVNPNVRTMALANRLWLTRAVQYVMRQQSVTQILDIGCGLPTSSLGLPNIHQVAEQIVPEVRVVYVDNDPIVGTHARALLAKGIHDFYPADLTAVDALVASMKEWSLDPSKSVLVLLGAVLHFYPSSQPFDPYRAVRKIMAAVPSGSYLAITHGEDCEELRTAAKAYDAASTQLRTPEQVQAFFQGMEMVKPGLVRLHEWRPPEDDPNLLDPVPVLGGLALKP